MADAGGEVNRVEVEAGSASAGVERPEVVIDERQAVCAVDGAEVCVGGEVVDEDLTVAEVADEQIAGVGAEAGGAMVIPQGASRAPPPAIC